MESERTALEKMSDGINLIAEGFGETVNNILLAITRVCDDILSGISEILNKTDWEIRARFSKDPQIKKCYAIYRRTKKSRVKKKQQKKISKILEKKKG